MATLEHDASLEHDPVDRNPLLELDAAQRRWRWLAYAAALTSSGVLLLMLMLKLVA